MSAARRTAPAYLAAGLVSARHAAAARGEIVGRAGFHVVLLLVFSRVWRSVPLPAGADPRDFVWYLAITEWVILSIPRVHLDIERDVRTGEIAHRLARPLSYVGWRVAEAVGALLVRLATLAVVGGGAAYLLAGGLPRDARGLVAAVPLGVLAGVLGIVWQAAVGLTAVWLEDVSPVYWLWQKASFVLGGLVLPLSLYPEWLARVARASPFGAMLFGPGRQAFGFDGAAVALDLARIVGWGVVGVACVVALERRGRRRLDVNGG